MVHVFNQLELLVVMPGILSTNSPVVKVLGLRPLPLDFDNRVLVQTMTDYRRARSGVPRIFADTRTRR